MSLYWESFLIAGCRVSAIGPQLQLSLRIPDDVTNLETCPKNSAERSRDRAVRDSLRLTRASAELSAPTDRVVDSVAAGQHVAADQQQGGKCESSHDRARSNGDLP
jgi:hypothetical protein